MYFLHMMMLYFTFYSLSLNENIFYSITRTSTNQLCHPLLRPPKLNVVVPLHDTRLVLLNTRVVLTLANIDCHPAPMAHKTRVVDWKLVQSPTSG